MLHPAVLNRLLLQHALRVEEAIQVRLFACACFEPGLCLGAPPRLFVRLAPFLPWAPWVLSALLWAPPLSQALVDSVEGGPVYLLELILPSPRPVQVSLSVNLLALLLAHQL